MLQTLRRRTLLVLFLLGCASGGFAAASAPSAATRPVIVFMTDFGVIDDAVAICKGVMIGIAPEAEIIDLTHQVTPFSISEGARLLGRTAQYYPSGTVFVTVIDPGVGTSRKSVIVKTKRGQFFVLPDNGLVTQVVDRDGVDGIREITNPKWMLTGSNSSTFHGRDVYSPVAAHLAHGEDWRDAGPAVATLTRLDVPQAVADPNGVKGLAVALDGPFGNLVTNVSRELFLGLGYQFGDTVRLSLGTQSLAVPFVATFGAVERGKPLAYIDSRGLFSLAINQGNFAESYHVAPPVALVIERR
jgi:hypothetical protein